MKNAHALKIHEGMMEISKGNQQSIDAATLLISAANTSMQYQTDPICMYKWLTKKKTSNFEWPIQHHISAKSGLNNLVIFKTLLRENLRKIAAVEDATSNQFYNPKLEVGALYNNSLSNIYGSISNEQVNVTACFETIVAYGDVFIDQLNSGLAAIAPPAK